VIRAAPADTGVMTLDSTPLPTPSSSDKPDDPGGTSPPAGPWSPAGTGSSRNPPRWWTLPIPVLLMLPAAAWSLLFAAVSGLMGCFDSCMPTAPLATPIGIADFFLALASVIALIVGLAVRTSRRGLRLALWIACVLAWTGAAYLFTWASNHP
jgi:hypothetical protein